MTGFMPGGLIEMILKPSHSGHNKLLLAARCSRHFSRTYSNHRESPGPVIVGGGGAGGGVTTACNMASTSRH